VCGKSARRVLWWVHVYSDWLIEFQSPARGDGNDHGDSLYGRGLLCSIDLLYDEKSTFAALQLVKGITRIQKAAEKMSEVVETLKRLYGTHSRTLGLIEFKPFFTDMMTLIKEDLDREGINLKIDDHSGPDSTLWGKAQEINYAVSTILRYIITLAKYSPTKEIDLVILDAYNQVAISIQSNVFYESLNPFNEILNLSIINKILEANGGSVDFSRAQTSGLVSLYLPRAAGVSSASG
jgi:hypothetical protein